MKLKFSYNFNKKRVLALVEALLALGIFFVYFAPQVYYYTSVGHKETYYNGFESYLGKANGFSTSFGGVFFIILLVLAFGILLTKMFVSDKKYKALNILAVIVLAIAAIFISLATTGLMIETTKATSRIAYAYGAWLGLGLLVGLAAFILVDLFALKN